MTRARTALRSAAAVLGVLMVGVVWPVAASANTGDGSSSSANQSAISASAAGDSSASDATTHGRIDHVEPGSPQHDTEVLFSIPGLGKSVNLDQGSVEVTVDGSPVTAKVSTVTGGTVKRISVMVLDLSQSMKGKRLEGAIQAALTFVHSAPADVYIGLVTFAGDVNVVQTPTLDRTALTTEVQSLTLQPGVTQLYPAAEKALDVAGKTGARSLLLLTDGADRSKVPLTDVVDKAHESGVRVDAIGLFTTEKQGGQLAQIANSTKGSFTTATDVSDIQKLFAARANELAKQLLISFPVPKGLVGTDASLSVSATAGGTQYEDHGFVVIGQAAEEVAGPPDYQAVPPKPLLFNVSKPLMWGGIGALVLGVGAMLAYGLTRLSPAKQEPWQRQIKFYTTQGVPAAQAAIAAPGPNAKRSALNLASRLMSSRDLEGLLTRKLQAGAVRFTASEWMLLHIGIAIAAGIIGLTLGGPLAMVILLSLGITLPWMYLVFKESRRKRAFQSQLADTLQVMASGLQAGQSLPQAVDTAAKEGGDPVASEFRKAIVEQRLGIDITDSLDDVAERMGSQDFRWVVMAIRIQRDVGGNLAELINTVASTLREREYLRRQVKTLSAEGRLSAWIIGALPPVFIVYLILVRRQYLEPMLHSTLGWVMIGYAIVSMIVGVFWLSKVVKVDA